MTIVVLTLTVFVLAVTMLSVGVILRGQARLKGACHDGKGQIARAADGTPLACDDCICEAEKQNGISQIRPVSAVAIDLSPPRRS